MKKELPKWPKPITNHAIGLTKPHQPIVKYGECPKLWTNYTRIKANKPKLQKIERKRNGERVYVYTDGSHLMEYEFIAMKDLL